MNEPHPTDPVSGPAISPVPKASPCNGFVPVFWSCRSCIAQERSRSLSPCAKNRRAGRTNSSREANNDDTQDCGWRACSKGAVGHADCLAVNHTAPGLAAHYWLALGVFSGGTRTTDPGSERQVCSREHQSQTGSLCPSFWSWRNWRSERAITRQLPWQISASAPLLPFFEVGSVSCSTCTCLWLQGSCYHLLSRCPVPQQPSLPGAQKAGLNAG